MDFDRGVRPEFFQQPQDGLVKLQRRGGRAEGVKDQSAFARALFQCFIFARVLFRQYFFPFEVTSILLIVAAIAAMVLAQRRVRSVTQAELDEAAAAAEEEVPA